MHVHPLPQRTGDLSVLGMLYPTQTRVSHTSAKRQKPLMHSWMFSAHVACTKEPWPCLCSPAWCWDTGSRSNMHNLHASAEPLPGRCGSHCNAIKHTNTTAQFQPQPPAPSRKAQSLFQCCTPCCKEKQKGLNVLYHLRWKTFLLGLKRGNKHLESP